MSSQGTEGTRRNSQNEKLFLDAYLGELIGTWGNLSSNEFPFFKVTYWLPSLAASLSICTNSSAVRLPRASCGKPC